MALTATLAQMVAEARAMTDMEGASELERFPAATIERWVNQGLAAWCTLVIKYCPEQLEKPTTGSITTANGTSIYDLPTDFFRLISVEVPGPDSRYRPIDTFPVGERSLYEPPDGIVVCRVRYIPVFTFLTNTTPGTTDVFDVGNLWADEYAASYAARKIVHKESDYEAVKSLSESLREIEARIEAFAADRVIGQPPKVTDIYNRRAIPVSGTGVVTAFRLFGNAKIELLRLQSFEDMEP